MSQSSKHKRPSFTPSPRLSKTRISHAMAAAQHSSSRDLRPQPAYSSVESTVITNTTRMFIILFRRFLVSVTRGEFLHDNHTTTPGPTTHLLPKQPITSHTSLQTLQKLTYRSIVPRTTMANGGRQKTVLVHFMFGRKDDARNGLQTLTTVVVAHQDINRKRTLGME